MTIKISTFKSVLQANATFNEENKQFIESIEEGLGEKITLSPLEDYECDLKLIFIQTGGAEGIFLKNIKNLQEPFYLLTSGANNSLAASLEIMTYLKLHNKKGEIIHGSFTYISSRIKQLAQIEQAKRNLKKTRLGILGKPSDWLIASVPSYERVEEVLGVKLIDIPLDTLDSSVNEVSFLPNVSYADKNFNLEEVKKAEVVSNCLARIVYKYNLDGLTIRCFDLLTSLKRTGCLGLSKLNDSGTIGTCEGDIMAMLSMYMIKALTNKVSFQANPSLIDVKNNEMILAHCTIPLSMVDSYCFDTHFESGISVAIKGKMRVGRVTIFRLSANLKDYTLYSGIILNNLNEKNLCRTQIKVKIDGDISQLLTNPCGNHLIVCYGDETKIIKAFLDSVLVN